MVAAAMRFDGDARNGMRGNIMRRARVGGKYIVFGLKYVCM